MPQINLTNASGQELRQWLDASRRSGDAALTYKILQEMAARRDAPAKPRRVKARGAEPRLVTVEFGEAVAEDDIPPMRNWPPRPEIEAEPEPLDFDRPLSLRELELEPAPVVEEGLYVRASQPKGAGMSVRRVAGVMLAITTGLALGWLGGWLSRDAMSEPAAPPPAAIQTAALAPEPVAPVAPEPVAVTPPETPAAEPEPAAIEAPAESEASAPEGPALELPAPVKASAAEAPQCARAPTPADREICADDRLQDLQRDLRRAYAEALDAHEDRALLRQRQLAWRDARNDVTDPNRLARLYEQRIQKLHAAAAEARAAAR